MELFWVNGKKLNTLRRQQSLAINENGGAIWSVFDTWNSSSEETHGHKQ